MAPDHTASELQPLDSNSGLLVQAVFCGADRLHELS